MKKSSLAIAALLTVLSATQLSVAFADDSSAPAQGTDNSAPAAGDSNSAPATNSSDDGDDTGS